MEVGGPLMVEGAPRPHVRVAQDVGGVSEGGPHRSRRGQAVTRKDWRPLKALALPTLSSIIVLWKMGEITRF